ncbi:hypothetical protein DYB26_006609, partial [Aphanomyces astaci]
DQESYEKSIKEISEFRTVQGFWRVYNHLIRPNDLPNTTDYHLFKAGIKPMWEDTANRRGGKWMIRIRKGIASRYWEDLVLAIVGEQFDVGNEICGAVMSIRYNEDIISLWNRNADNSEACYRIRYVRRPCPRIYIYIRPCPRIYIYIYIYPSSSRAGSRRRTRAAAGASTWAQRPARRRSKSSRPRPSASFPAASCRPGLPTTKTSAVSSAAAAAGGRIRTRKACLRGAA